MQTNNRRWFLKALGAGVATAAVAGCVGDDDDDGNGGNGNGGDNDPESWEGVTEITIRGFQTHWEGVEPSFLDGLENPTWYLTAGEEYTLEWINGDGVPHDFNIENDAGDTLEDTDDIQTEGDSLTLTFTASEEMTTYVCNYHRSTQIGDIEIQ